MADQPEVDVRMISPGYLHAMRIPVVAGPRFERRRRGGPAPVVFISESMAKRFWPRESDRQALTLNVFSRCVGSRRLVGDVKQILWNQTRPVETL